MSRNIFAQYPMITGGALGALAGGGLAFAGGGLGNYMSKRQVDESDEDFDSRRRRNRILGSVAGLGLGAAAGGALGSLSKPKNRLMTSVVLPAHMDQAKLDAEFNRDERSLKAENSHIQKLRDFLQESQHYESEREARLGAPSMGRRGGMSAKEVDEDFAERLTKQIESLESERRRRYYVPFDGRRSR